MKKHKNAEMENALCWECKNCINGCSWSRDGIPPKNSVYEKVEYKQHNDKRNKAITVPSYHIISCGEFVPDDNEPIKDMSNDSMADLLEAAIKRWSLDYYNALMTLKLAADGIGMKEAKINAAQRAIDEGRYVLTAERREELALLAEKNYKLGKTKPSQGNLKGDWYE